MPSPVHEDARKTSAVASTSQRRRLSPGPNGKRLGLIELNLEADRADPDQEGRWLRFIHALELFLAGMYTGESCAGTPRDEHPSTPTGPVPGGGAGQAADAGRGKKQ